MSQRRMLREGEMEADTTGLQKKKIQLHGIFAYIFFSFFAKLEEFSFKKHSSNEKKINTLLQFLVADLCNVLWQPLKGAAKR